jgi:hypothetical protein
MTMLSSISPCFTLHGILKLYANQGWKKKFIFWDRNEKWENFLQVVDANPV